MTDNVLRKSAKQEVSKNFKSEVKNLLNTLRANADGENIVVGTKEKPIVTNSDKVPIEHFFMDEVYVRKMTMYKGSAVSGAVHKHLHMSFLLTGRVTVVGEEGMVERVAPCTIIAQPGTKRVIYSHEDTIWYTVHKNPSNTEDLDQLEKEIVAVSYKEYEEYIKNK